MIFVTIGMHPKGFPRLLEKMDQIAGNIDEKVVMQIGYTKYMPKNAEYFDFKSEDEILELYRKARVIVCHAGAGSIIMAMQYGKPVITVPRWEGKLIAEMPRWKKHGRISYDDQADLALELEKEGQIKVVYDVEDLEKALNDIDITSMIKVQRNKRLVNALKEYISRKANNLDGDLK